MERETVFATLIDIMEADTGASYPDLKENADLRQDLGLDSVDVVSIVSQVERRFRVRLSQTELERLVTVKNVVDLVHGKIKETV